MMVGKESSTRFRFNGFWIMKELKVVGDFETSVDCRALLKSVNCLCKSSAAQ